MKKLLNLFFLLIFMLAAAASTYAADPVATSFSATASTAGATLLQLQGADSDLTPLTFAIVAGPSHGTLSGLVTATGYVIYTPTAAYTGADSFTFKVTSGAADSNTATVSLTVTNAKTRIVDTLVDSAGTPRSGMVTFILTQKATSPGGIIPVSQTVSAVLNGSGQYDVSLYPSTALTPQSYYQMWYTATGSLRQELIGVYAIPASSATSILLAPYAVTSANLAAQYSFMPAAALNALVAGLGSPVVSFNGRTGAITPATNDYTWAQIDKTTSSLANITTRSASDLSSGTLPDARFPSTLPALNGSALTALNATNLASGTVAPARLGSLTDTALVYKTSSNLADSPLLRYSANVVGFGAGTPAAPSTSSSLTGTRLLMLDGSSGQFLGQGVESGAFWFNAGSTNSYKFYFGADSTYVQSISKNQYRIDTDQNSFTFNWQTASVTPENAAFILTSNAETIRIRPAADDDSSWEFTSNDFSPFLAGQTIGGQPGHYIGAVYSATFSLKNATSGFVNMISNGTTGNFTLNVPAATDTLVAKATTDTLTNKTIDAEGTGNSVTIPVKFFLAAAGCNNATAGSLWDLPASNPAAAACVTGTNIQKGVLDFVDAGATSAQNTAVLPADFTGAIDVRIFWTTTATSGNAKWSFSTICTDTAASATDDPAFNTASTVTTAAPGTANRVQTSAITGVTATGCSAGNLLHVKILRDGTDGSDTIGATARLIGVEVTIRRAM